MLAELDPTQKQQHKLIKNNEIISYCLKKTTKPITYTQNHNIKEKKKHYNQQGACRDGGLYQLVMETAPSWEAIE